MQKVAPLTSEDPITSDAERETPFFLEMHWWSASKGTLNYLHFFLLWCISLGIVRLSIHKMEKLVTRFGGTTSKEHQ